jgi:biotin transporter BioY
LILVTGSAWLHLLFRVPFAQAFLLGFTPFLIADVAKVALVGCALPRVLRRFEGGR